MGRRIGLSSRFARRELQVSRPSELGTYLNAVSALISAMCACVLGVRALLISVFLFLGRLVAEVGPRTSLNGLGPKFAA
jgi:hypothetical protein